jgi:alkylation response protein AidB-like acyl-CoA dehydrogenase
MTKPTEARGICLDPGSECDHRSGRDHRQGSLIELQPRTRAGARLVASSEALAEQLAATAAEHDARGTYLFENVAILKHAGSVIAPIPEPFGGRDVDSLYDVLVASSRLARGDAATTLGLNMHLLVVLNIVRRWRRCHGGPAGRQNGTT